MSIQYFLGSVSYKKLEYLNVIKLPLGNKVKDVYKLECHGEELHDLDHVIHIHNEEEIIFFGRIFFSQFLVD